MEPNEGNEPDPHNRSLLERLRPGAERRSILPPALTARLEVLKLETGPLLNEADNQTTAFEESVQSFVVKPSPESFRELFTTLAGTGEAHPLEMAQQEARQATWTWEDSLKKDTKVLELALGEKPTGASFEQLQHALTILQDRKQGLNRTKLEGLRNHLQIRQIDQQLEIAGSYLDAYQKSIGVVDEHSQSLKARTAEASKKVASALESKQSQSSEIQQAFQKPNIIDALEDGWLHTRVTTPLKLMEEKFITNRRRGSSDNYGSRQEETDREAFRRLALEYRDLVKERTEAAPRTTDAWRETLQGWERDRKDTHYYYRQFEDVGLGREFDNLAGRLTLKGNQQEVFAYSENQTELDLRPRSAFIKWAGTFADFQESASWNFPEVQQALKNLDYRHPYYGILLELSGTADHFTPGRQRDGINTPDPSELTKLPSFDRWAIVRTHLQNQNLASAEQLDQFEQKLIDRLAFEVLLRGGHESWDGTHAAYDLKQLGSPQALEPLLYFQTLISGSHGLYSAGHTNAAVQGVLESLLLGTSPETISQLPAPQFVKDTLLTLRDISGEALGDEYGRSYLTAGLVAGRFKEAVTEIRQHWEDPGYRRWTTALLRGMKNSTQPFSEESYQAMIGLLDLDPNLQSTVVTMLAQRIKNREQMGVTSRINADFTLALDSLTGLMDRENFDRSPDNLGSIYFALSGLQEQVFLGDLSQAQQAKIHLVYAQMGTAVGIPTPENANSALRYRDEIVSRMVKWMDDPQTTSVARFMILQTLDLVENDSYPQTNQEIAKLFQDRTLADQMNNFRIGHSSLFYNLNFLRDINLHGYDECLTDLLLRRNFRTGEQNSINLIHSQFRDYPNTRGTITEWFKHYATQTYSEEHPREMQIALEGFDRYVLGDDSELSKAASHLLSERVYYLKDKYARDLLLQDFDQATSEQKETLFDDLRKITHLETNWIGQERPTDSPEALENYEYAHETVSQVADRMRFFLASGDLKRQFGAVYLLNLFQDRTEEFIQAVQQLLDKTHDLEKLIPGATHALDTIRDRLNQSPT